MDDKTTKAFPEFADLDLYDDRAAQPCTAGPASEVERLRAAVAYCRRRLKAPGYVGTLDAILRGDRDAEIRNPDRTPIVQSNDADERRARMENHNARGATD